MMSSKRIAKGIRNTRTSVSALPHHPTPRSARAVPGDGNSVSERGEKREGGMENEAVSEQLIAQRVAHQAVEKAVHHHHDIEVQKGLVVGGGGELSYQPYTCSFSYQADHLRTPT